jgi:hypothetical protein
MQTRVALNAGDSRSFVANHTLDAKRTTGQLIAVFKNSCDAAEGVPQATVGETNPTLCELAGRRVDADVLVVAIFFVSGLQQAGVRRNHRHHGIQGLAGAGVALLVVVRATPVTTR